jgi:SAM-dependent methyltransferase
MASPAGDRYRGYWEAVLEGQYDLRGTGFPELPLSWNEWMYRSMRHSVDRLIDRHQLTATVEAASVLEIGSGVGHWLQYWRNRSVKSLHGCDLTATAVGELQRRFPDVAVSQVDIGAANPPIEGRFDVISVMAVLQHIADDERWRQALRNISDLLADDGTAVIIDVPLTHSLWIDEKPDGGMSWARSRAEWDDALGDAGLVISDLVPTTFTLAADGDSAHRGTSAAWHRYWRLVQQVTGKRERVGQVAGGVAFGVDQLLVRSGLNGVSSKTFLVRHREH